jgi:Uma2 family endonuclease
MNMASTLHDPFDRPLTQRDLDDTPADGNRYELIDGELYVTPFPNTAHQSAVTRLVVFLCNHVDANDLGRVFRAGLKVALDEPTGVGPDIVYVSNSRMDGIQADGFYGAPDLVVEVLSSKPGLDKHVKRKKYARAGIPHYWIVDPEARELWAYQLDGDAYRVVAELRGEAIFEPAIFPGLTIALERLWF